MRIRSKKAACAMWIQLVMSALLLPCAWANRAIITLLDNTLWTYRAEVADFGYVIDDKFVYHATMMIPPDDSQLCSFPSSLLDPPAQVKERIEQLKSPVGLLVSLGGCSVEQKVAIGVMIHRDITKLVRFLVFYNNDPNNPDEIFALEGPGIATTAADDPMDVRPLINYVDQMAFVSVSTSTGSAMLGRVQQLAQVSKKNPIFLGETSYEWSLQMFLETLNDYGRDPSSSPRTASSNFYWFRIILFSLLILSPCCRAAYLWWAGGGRVRLRRNENDRFIGFHYTPPMSYWFASGAAQENAPSINDRLTEEQVMALPEIVYTSPPPDPDEVREGDEYEPEETNGESLPEVDITVPAGSVDASLDQVKKDDCIEIETSDDAEQPKTTDDAILTTSCTTCSICIDEFEPGERIRLLPRCRHAFHTDCILPWLTGRQGNCPLCKTSVMEGDDANTEDSDTNADFANALGTPERNTLTSLDSTAAIEVEENESREIVATENQTLSEEAPIRPKDVAKQTQPPPEKQQQEEEQSRSETELYKSEEDSVTKNHPISEEAPASPKEATEQSQPAPVRHESLEYPDDESTTRKEPSSSLLEAQNELANSETI